MLRYKLHIFPLIELAFILVSFYWVNENIGLSILSIVLAALFMNFSLHITIHHYVHFKFKNKIVNRIMEMIYSVLLGLPFNFYRIQHYNHHRYNNRIGDITSTWKEKNQTILPKHFFRYSFFWFWTKPKGHFFKEAMEKGDLTKPIFSRMRIELILIICIYGILFYVNPLFALAYFILFYLGWTFIAITNFGQHLPIKYGDTIGYSYKNKAYNYLFFNNGLHFEHHENPTLDYPELQAQNKSIINKPHLISGLFGEKCEVKK